MRYSRILAVLIVLCFTFAGTTMLFAKDQTTIDLDGKKITITYDAVTNRAEVKDAADKPVNVVGPPIGGHVGEGKLRLHTVNGPPETIISVTEGCEINTTYNPTCTWKFTGGDWVKTCVYP